jgi:uncharacterized membrane protein YhaH (DUF805 family)
MNSFKKYFWNVIKNQYVDFSGVATRRQYWMFVLWEMLLTVVPIFIIVSIWGITAFMSEVVDSGISYNTGYSLVPSLFVGVFVVFAIIVLIGCIIPSIAISVRRLHDIGLSGWFLSLNLIPYLGGLIIFVFHLLPSKIEDNKYYNSKINKVSENDISMLEKLYSLREKGVITEEEFKTKKTELLK